MRGIVVLSCLLIALIGCARSGQPKRLGDVRNIPRNAPEFIERATRESELFRGRFLAEEGAEVLRATVDFQRRAAPLLAERPGVEEFDLDPERLLDRIRGSGALSAERVFGNFSGRWYGLWTDFEVDHHWGEVIESTRPRRVEIPEHDRTVWVRGYQYAWVGDGYGINLVVNGDPSDSRGDYILGYVVHVEDGDVTRERVRRPHVGIFAGEGRLIWITASEVFLEASYTTASGEEAYAITGFRYEVSTDGVKIGECFQARYTRDPGRRPEFLSFSL